MAASTPMIACQALREYCVMLDAALIVGVTAVEAKEVVYQAVPYVGMAKVYDFLHATNEVLTERDVQLPLPGQANTTPETRAEKGREVQEQIIGADLVDTLYAPPRKIRYTYSAISRPIALAITSRATPSMFRRANCSL